MLTFHSDFTHTPTKRGSSTPAATPKKKRGDSEPDWFSTWLKKQGDQYKTLAEQNERLIKATEERNALLRQFTLTLQNSLRQ